VAWEPTEYDLFAFGVEGVMFLNMRVRGWSTSEFAIAWSADMESEKSMNWLFGALDMCSRAFTMACSSAVYIDAPSGSRERARGRGGWWRILFCPHPLSHL
jgi:hypothetical protein